MFRLPLLPIPEITILTLAPAHLSLLRLSGGLK
jgi:hypothetical protein